MRYAMLLLATLALASPALADGKGHKNHDPATPAQVAKADARVANDVATIGKIESYSPINARVLSNEQHRLAVDQRWAALLHESCGC